MNSLFFITFSKNKSEPRLPEMQLTILTTIVMSCRTLYGKRLNGRDGSYKLVSLMKRPDPDMAEGVGMWSTLMEAMGILSVLTNSAIICFTGGALNDK